MCSAARAGFESQVGPVVLQPPHTEFTEVDALIALREQIVHGYKIGLVPTYNKVAQMFGVGRASVSRLLRLDRETDSVEPSRWGAIALGR